MADQQQAPAARAIRENVMLRQEGNVVWLGFDITKNLGKTGSGKSTNVASTSGFTEVGTVNGQPVRASLNVITK